MERLTDPIRVGNMEVSLINNPSGEGNRYFERGRRLADTDVLVECNFPDQKLRSHSFVINATMIDSFIDSNRLNKEYISNKSYERFECFICMRGSEKRLYIHESANRMHIHKSCYEKLAEAVESLAKEHTALITQNEL